MILVVDDDRTIRESISFILARAGHLIVSADDGSEAVALLAAHQFHVMITDIHMPGVSGPEVIARARQLPSCPKIIVMSAGKGGQSAADHLRHAGQEADAVLNKPFSLAAMIDCVNLLVAAATGPNKQGDAAGA